MLEYMRLNGLEKRVEKGLDNGFIILANMVNYSKLIKDGKNPDISKEEFNILLIAYKGFTEILTNGQLKRNPDVMRTLKDAYRTIIEYYVFR